jgi:hypothetical protein
MPRARKARKLTGGARTTAEAVAGLVMHPKDSLQDFKDFFGELGKIWNNGNVGDGLRQHGVAASNLLIKYLPLGGAPGYAAATALEKLQVTKWINLLATLIDFVSGKGNIMDFLNAFKDLVGDIFKIIGDAIASLVTNPEQITNAINTVANVVGQATTALGTEIVDVFQPGYKAQSDAYRAQENLKAQENSHIGNIIEAVQEDAQDQYDADPPESFEDALDVVLKFGVDQAGSGYYKAPPGGVGPSTRMYSPDQAPQALKDAIAELATRSKQSPTFFQQYGRVRDSPGLYIIPFLEYLRKNWAERPEIYKDPKGIFYEPLQYSPGTTGYKDYDNQKPVPPLPVIPDWKSRQNDLLMKSPQAGGDQPMVLPEYQKWLGDWQNIAESIRKGDKVDRNSPAYLAEIQRQKDEVKKRDEDRAEADRLSREANTPRSRAKRYNFAVTRLMKAVGLPVNWPDGEGPYRTDMGPDVFSEGAIPERLSTVPQYFTPLGNEYVKTMLEGYPASVTEQHFQPTIDEYLKWNPKPAAATPAPTPEAAVDPAAARPAEPAAPAAPAAPEGAAEPEEEEEDIPMTLYGGSMTGGSKHPFRHLESQRERVGKRPRLQLLDPYFFEGTL